MESPIELKRDGSGRPESVKARLLATRELLVASLYNLAPLLDRMLASSLLSSDNYYEVKAEQTPPNRARKLLEVVQAQMDEEGAAAFLECLRSCESHYPRLRSWLRNDTDIHRGLTELKLKAQFSRLCGRLGSSVLPVSLRLFSDEVLTQFELDQVQAGPTTYQQTQRLLTVCLSKGERACNSFYRALTGEDGPLAAEIDADTRAADRGSEQSLLCGFPVAVEETNTPVQPGPWERWPREAVPTDEEKRGVLQQVTALLGEQLGSGAGLNVRDLGVAVGLPRRAVMERLLEDVGLDDRAQLQALVTLFLEKTRDGPRLLRRLTECDPQRFQLSERGRLLLKLLLQADALLFAGDKAQQTWHIISFVLWDTLAQAVEEAEPWEGVAGRDAEPWECMAGPLHQLRGSERVEAELLQELEECWAEPTDESLRQSILVLAQMVRDLYPQQDSLQLCAPREAGAMTPCHPHRLHRVTRFTGLPGRVVRKALGSLPPESAPVQSQYREICLSVVRLLERVDPSGGRADLQAATGDVGRHIRSTLSRPAFCPEAFDAGVRQRTLSVPEFDPTELGLPALLALHRDSLAALGQYLRPSERHSFQLHPEAVLVLEGGAELRWVASMAGPVAIDDATEEAFRFVFAGPASALVRLRCDVLGPGGVRLQAVEPRCVRVTGLAEGSLAGLQVLASEQGAVWVRERVPGTVDSSLGSAQREAGCCFLINTPGPECQVTFIYRGRRITAIARDNCQVL